MIRYMGQRIKGILPNIYYVILIFAWPSKLCSLRKLEYIRSVAVEPYQGNKAYWDDCADTATRSVYIYRNAMLWSIIKIGLSLIAAYYSAIYARQNVQPYIINDLKIVGVCSIFLAVAGKVNATGILTMRNDSISERANNSWNRYLYLFGIYLSLTTLLI